VAKHSGRLELIWTDKDEALLPTDDGRYDYTYVDPFDFRVSEVRLLLEVSRHDGEIFEDFEPPFEPTKRVHSLVESKVNKGITSEDVIAKRKAAVTWSNTVTNSGNVEGPRRYLLLSEDDVKDSSCKWGQMKVLYSG
jgi:hypothetical protein